MAEAVKTLTAGTDIALQPASEDIWDSKYRPKDRNGNPVDDSVLDTYKRVAQALAEAEERRKKAKEADVPKEYGGRDGPEPVRYGDWEKKGLAIDF